MAGRWACAIAFSTRRLSESLNSNPLRVSSSASFIMHGWRDVRHAPSHSAQDAGQRKRAPPDPLPSSPIRVAQLPSAAPARHAHHRCGDAQATTQRTRQGRRRRCGGGRASAGDEGTGRSAGHGRTGRPRAAGEAAGRRRTERRPVYESDGTAVIISISIGIGIGIGIEIEIINWVRT